MNLLSIILSDNAYLSAIEKEKIAKHEELSFTSDTQGFIKNMQAIISIIAGQSDEIHPQTSYILSAQKRLGEYPFNDLNMVRRGLHAFRVAFAHYAHQKRNRTNNSLNSFDDIGLVKINNFLQDEQAQELLKEAKQFDFATAKNKTNILAFLSEEQFPNLYHFIRNPQLISLILDSIKSLKTQDALSKYQSNTFVQRMINSPNDGDIQKELHSDIFFPAVKFWYFPHRVNIGEGCFTYSKKSVKLTPDLLAFHYEQSLKCAENRTEEWRDGSNLEGSFRISSDELSALHLAAEEVEVEENSLVIANVFGFHGRGQTYNEAERITIHGSIRLDQPFSI